MHQVTGAVTHGRVLFCGVCVQGLWVCVGWKWCRDMQEGRERGVAVEPGGTEAAAE